MLPVELLQLNSRYDTDQDRISVVRQTFTVRYENPKQGDRRIYTEIKPSNNYPRSLSKCELSITISVVKFEIFLICIDQLYHLNSWKSTICPGYNPQKISYFFKGIFVQSLHPRLPPRFPPNLPPRLSPWLPQGKYLRQSPLISLQNNQAHFLLLILLLVCDFIFLVFMVLSDCYICRIHVILYQHFHIHSPLMCNLGGKLEGT